MFDTTLLKPVTFKFVSTTTDGVATYKYVAVIPPTQVGTEALPGALVGKKAPTVTLPEMFSSTETYYVDPVTGAPLQVERDTHQVLADASRARPSWCCSTRTSRPRPRASRPPSRTTTTTGT